MSQCRDMDTFPKLLTRKFSFIADVHGESTVSNLPPPSTSSTCWRKSGSEKPWLDKCRLLHCILQPVARITLTSTFWVGVYLMILSKTVYSRFLTRTVGIAVANSIMQMYVYVRCQSLERDWLHLDPPEKILQHLQATVTLVVYNLDLPSSKTVTTLMAEGGPMSSMSTTSRKVYTLSNNSHHTCWHCRHTFFL